MELSERINVTVKVEVPARGESRHSLWDDAETLDYQSEEDADYSGAIAFLRSAIERLEARRSRQRPGVSLTFSGEPQ